MTRRLLITFLLIFGNCLLQGTPLSDQEDARTEIATTLPAELTGKVVTALLKDHLGYLWIGTDVGLFRYDRYGLETYQHDFKNPHSLSNHVITALTEI